MVAREPHRRQSGAVSAAHRAIDYIDERIPVVQVWVDRVFGVFRRHWEGLIHRANFSLDWPPTRPSLGSTGKSNHRRRFRLALDHSARTFVLIPSYRPSLRIERSSSPIHRRRARVAPFAPSFHRNTNATDSSNRHSTLILSFTRALASAIASDRSRKFHRPFPSIVRARSFVAREFRAFNAEGNGGARPVASEDHIDRTRASERRRWGKIYPPRPYTASCAS